MSYEHILAYEHHFHLFMHLFGAFVTTILLYGADFFRNRNRLYLFLSGICVLVAASVIELIQWKIGRNVEWIDFALGFCGVVIAILTVELVARLIRNARNSSGQSVK